MLDRTRPFTTVYGIADHAFSQDGKQFDREGNELGAPLEKPAKGKPAKPGKPEPDQVAAQLNG